MESDLNLGALYRSWWALVRQNIDIICSHASKKKVEVGFSLISDDIGGGVKKRIIFCRFCLFTRV
jgi:hypothetical protein